MQPGTYPRNKHYAAALPKGERGANDNLSSDSFDATAISIATFFGAAVLLAAVAIVASLAKLGWL